MKKVEWSHYFLFFSCVFQKDVFIFVPSIYNKGHTGWIISSMKLKA